MKIRHSAGFYFALQSLAVVCWWMILFLVPESRGYFKMGEGATDTTLFAFWLPDLFLLAAGSAMASVFCFLEHKSLPHVLWFVCGTIAYATFYCLAFALLTDSGWLGVTFMFPAMIWSGVFTIALSSIGMFRRAKSSSTSWILIKTIAQILVVWGLILFVFPYFIIHLEDKIGVPRFDFPFQNILATILFIGISLIGLSSAYTMSKIGRGTPLPLDAASKLVIQGTYSFVRNPMAISGVGQGLAVGLFLGSPLVIIYALMGGMIWQLVFRPLEENDLAIIFGQDYKNYRQNVRCWIPRVKPYQIEGTAVSSNSIELPLGKI